MYIKNHKHSKETKLKIGNANRGNKRPGLAEFNRTRTDLKGRLPWNKGLKTPRCGVKKGNVPWNKNKPWSDEIKHKISIARKGKGLNPNRDTKHNGWKLQEWSRLVIDRDGKCKGCESKNNLEAHHILPKALYPKKIYDVNNGLTLCRKCHKKTDTYGKRLDLKVEEKV